MAEAAASDRELTRDEITNQARFLLSDFIHKRLVQEGLIEASEMEQLQELERLVGQPTPELHEISQAIRSIADAAFDEYDRDSHLQELIAKLEPGSEKNTFYDVASQLFADGFNWGRVIALFYFAYKQCERATVSDKRSLIQATVNITVEFIRDKIAAWIIERGGWGAVREYFGPTWKQWAFVAGACVAATVMVMVIKAWRSS